MSIKFSFFFKSVVIPQSESFLKTGQEKSTEIYEIAQLNSGQLFSVQIGFSRSSRHRCSFWRDLSAAAAFCLAPNSSLPHSASRALCPNACTPGWALWRYNTCDFVVVSTRKRRGIDRASCYCSSTVPNVCGPSMNSRVPGGNKRYGRERVILLLSY